MVNSTQNKSKEMLERWVISAKEYLFSPPDRDDLMVYGTGTNVWGAQTHQKGFAAIAVAAADPDYDQSVSGYLKDELLDIACKLFRFTLESHHAGSYHGMTDENEKWGHHWLGSLGIERMMIGVDAIWDCLTDNDKKLIRKVFISEAEWVLNEHPLRADIIRPNVPESNIWCGAFLHRVAMMYPDCENAKKYMEKGTAFLLNGICIPSDAKSNEMFDGIPLKDWVVGANFPETYSLHHHAYFNVGYMVICLSNIALYHFECKKRQITPPKALYQHSEKLWQLVKAMIFPDGRLIRAGGDTRVRYCYCQDYLLPALHFARDAFGEDTASLIEGWKNIVYKEFTHNNDNSFLSDRCELLIDRSILYYTRLESDRACCLAYDLYYSRIFKETKPYGTKGYSLDDSFKKPISLYKDETNGVCFSRTDKNFFSFCWSGGESPMALAIPLCDSSVAEWKNNMTSVFEGDGLCNYYIPLWHKIELINNGFMTIGAYKAQTEHLFEENINKADTIINNIAYVALPDSQTAVTIQYAFAPNRVHLSTVKAFNLNIPNDIFNDNKRNYIKGGDFINVDNKITIKSIYGGKPKVYTKQHRQIGIKNIGGLAGSIVFKNRGHLKCDEVCVAYVNKSRWYEKNETAADFAVAIVLNNSNENFTPLAETVIKNKMVRAVKIKGQDNKNYIIAANFGNESSNLIIKEKQLILPPQTVQVTED